MTRIELKFLKSLRDAPTNGLAWSRLPISCRGLVQRLCTCGAARIVPGRQGKRLCIASSTAFESVIRVSTPQGLDALDSVPTSRADAVEQYGDAKVIAAGKIQGILLRAIKPGIRLEQAGMTKGLDVTALTQLAGCAALILHAGVEWTFSGTIVTIENEEAFWGYESVLPDIDLAIYVRGKMSRRLLRWLASPAMTSCQIIHWGDYDPVGLLEYQRLRRACPGRVQIHIPENIESLVKRYGKRRLIQSGHQSKALTALRRVSDDPILPPIIRIFDLMGKGLEQEILLALASQTAKG